MTQVLLCSDQTLLVKDLESQLRRAGGYHLLPCCRTLALLSAQLAKATPEIVLIDLTAEVTFAVLTQTRRSIPDSKLILWVNTISTELALQAMALGIRGIMRKALPADMQAKCMERVRAGELWYEKAITHNLLSARTSPLSEREGELIALLSQGLKNKEIASVLSISEDLVKIYLAQLFERVGVKDRFELALFGMKNSVPGHRPAEENDLGRTHFPLFPRNRIVLH